MVHGSRFSGSAVTKPATKYANAVMPDLIRHPLSTWIPAATIEAGSFSHREQPFQPLATVEP
jgi:hypothetical protein